MKHVTVTFNKECITGGFSLPASKSISNRLLIIRFLAGDAVTIDNLSEAEDTMRLVFLLRKIRLHSHQSTPFPLTVDAGDSGTVLRFLTALLATTPGEYHITGSERMRQRPVGPLVEALRKLGAEVEYSGMAGFPPLRILSKKADGGIVDIDSGISSQFISALLLIAPVLKNGLTLHMKGVPVSHPYISMTTALLSRHGIDVQESANTFVIRPQSFSSCHTMVEADWSAASFWYEMAALAKQADFVLYGIDMESVQGDRAAAEIFKMLGVQTLSEQNGIRLIKNTLSRDPVRITMTGYPDLVLPFAVACSFVSRKASIRGIHHLEWKESNRLTALSSELVKAGVKADFSNDGQLYLPGTVPSARPSEPFQSWHDHRMVMAFAPLALYYGSIQITDPEVVTKSYPGYWDELRKAGFTLRE